MAAALNNRVKFTEGDVFSLRFPIIDAATKAPAGFTAPVVTFLMATGETFVSAAALFLTKTSPLGGARIVQENIDGLSTWVAYVDFIESDTKGVAGATGLHGYQVRVVDGARKATIATGVISIAPLMNV